MSPSSSRKLNAVVIKSLFRISKPAYSCQIKMIKRLKVVVVVDQDLSIRAADTNTNSLGTKEVTLSNFISTSARGSTQG
jgi:hypothetical protein